MIFLRVKSFFLALCFLIPVQSHAGVVDAIKSIKNRLAHRFHCLSPKTKATLARTFVVGMTAAIIYRLGFLIDGIRKRNDALHSVRDQTAIVLGDLGEEVMSEIMKTFPEDSSEDLIIRLDT